MLPRRLTLLIVAAVAGCGGDPPRERAPVAPPAAVPVPAVPVQPPVPAEVPAAPDPLAPLLAIWDRESDADEDAAADAVLNATPCLAARLVEMLGGDHDDYRLRALIGRFGAAALGPLVSALDDEHRREPALMILEEMAPDWAYGPEGPAVCRALVARLLVDKWSRTSEDALKRSRPAGRTVARQLAESLSTADAERRGAICSVLKALGPDAAEAVPVLRQAILAKPEDSGALLEALASTGDTDPAFVEPLVKGLSSSAEDVRLGSLLVLRNHDPLPKAARATLLAYLKADIVHDADYSELAWRALMTPPPADDADFRELVVIGGDMTNDVRDAAFAARLARLLPTLPAERMEDIRDLLWCEKSFDFRKYSETLTRDERADVRLLALGPWDDSEATDAVPSSILKLLEDPDARVRLEAARVFALREAVAAPQLLATALALIGSADPEVRKSAIEVISYLPEAGPKGLEALIGLAADADASVRIAALWELPADVPAARAVLDAALEDKGEGVRSAVLWHLLRSDALTDVTRRALLPEYLERFLAQSYVHLSPDFLFTVPGGSEALVAAIEKGLAGGRRSEGFDGALRAAVAVATRLPALRATLAGMRDTDDVFLQQDIDRALKAIDATPALDKPPDAEALAASGDTSAENLAKLRALGAPGLDAIVRLAGRPRWRGDDLLARLDGAELRESIEAAARAAGTDEATVERHKGAAQLAPLLSNEAAIAVLTNVARDEEALREAVRGLCEVEKRARGSVPLPLVQSLLHDSDGDRSWVALRLLEAMGSRAIEADAQILPELRKIRDGGSPGEAARCAAALWNLTHRAEEALPALRAILSRPERFDAPLAWAPVGRALLEMPLAKEDLAAVIAVVRRAATLCEPAEMSNEEPWGAPSYVKGALISLVPVLEHAGPAAAPAVPALCLILEHWGYGAGNEPGAEPTAFDAALRALVAIGSRDALPDLRRRAAVYDPDGVIRDAIRRIEAAPK